jgi:hypothetical protein
MSWLVPKRFKLIFRTQPDYLTDALESHFLRGALAKCR